MNFFKTKEEEKPVDSIQAPKETIPEVIDESENKIEESPSEVGARLKEIAERFDIPEQFEGREIISISGFKEVGSVTYAIVYCDNRCTYDVPLTPKQ